MPPIPGGDIMCYTLLFSSLGIPEEGVLLGSALSVSVDNLDSGLTILLLILRVTCHAASLDGVDREILLS